MTVHSWNSVHDANQKDAFKSYEAQLNHNMIKGNYKYLKSAASVALRNPAPLAAFVPSMNMPNGYDGLNAANKALYNQEYNRYAQSLKINNDLIREHNLKLDSAFSDLQDQFQIGCVARKDIDALIADAEAAVPPVDGDVTYRAIIADIETKYAPNKPVDIEFWQKRAQSLNIRDGRGFSINSTEFIEAVNQLTTLGVPPDRMMIQRWISQGFMKDSPLQLIPYLSSLGRLNQTDAVVGAVQPAIPRWRAFLTEVAAEIANFPHLDHFKSNDNKAETRVITNQASASTSYC